MKHRYLAFAAIIGLSLAASAQEVQTITRPDGTVQTIVPVTQQVCEMREKTNYGNAALGAATAGAGSYATAKMWGSRNAGAWGLGAAAVGALIGANTDNETRCVYVNKIVGHRVITVKNGKAHEAFIPSL